MATNTPTPVRALGDAQLDAEHEELQRLSEELLAAGPERLVAALDALRGHVAAHFEGEDQDLRRLGGHNAECHLDEHAAVLKSLEEVRMIVADPTSEGSAKLRLARRLASQLSQWLPEHVDQMDASVAAARDRERLGGTRVQITRQVVAR
jgi:hemerythrin-like metal-binding protein